MSITFKSAFAICLLLLSSLAYANGKITHLSGSVFLQKANAQKEPVVPDTEVSEGDTLITGANGYARMETTDGGEVVLRPGSEFHIEKYNYNKDKPEDDSFVYNLLKGGLRTVTGLIGKRGNKDAYLGLTPTSTIGIRGTFFEVRVCAGDCGSLADGTYFSVRSGSIQTGNTTGNLTMTAGQIVYVPKNGTPQVLPHDPGIGFTPPAAIPKQEEKKDNSKNSGNNNTAENNNNPSGSGNPPAGNTSNDGVSCSIQ